MEEHVGISKPLAWRGPFTRVDQRRLPYNEFPW